MNIFLESKQSQDIYIICVVEWIFVLKKWKNPANCILLGF